MGAMLGRARKQMPEASPLRSDLHEVATVAQGLLDHVRELSQTLHPSILDEIGLEGTLDWYLSTVERQSGVAVRYERSGPVVALDVNAAIQVYRILQEALTNVARHASATQVWVRLRVEPTSLNLEVEDHGRGLDEVRTLRGLGIVTMRERAALVGGTIEFVRPRAGGTLVRLRVPVQ
jgi:signal transduction histidine kinase